jgi:polo-like kinase 4
MSELSASSVMQQVISGVLYLHSHKILHRDISLSNLLLTQSMHVKISDFGLATQLNPSSPDVHRTLCGTPNYISPEVASRSSHGLPADVWSLGCMLYTLLVGRPPFETNGVKSTLTQVVMGSFQVPDHLSGEARDLIYRMLDKNPVTRIGLEEVAEHPFLKRFEGVPMDREDSGFSSGKLRASRSDFEPVVGSGSLYRQLSGLEVPSPAPLLASRSDFGPASLARDRDKALGPGVPPLTTERLQPTRHKTKNAILTILGSGEVVLEFTRFKPRLQEDRVLDVLRITSDGLRIVYYQPNPPKGLPAKSQPIEIPQTGVDLIFSYESLPREHWKKYLYAARFVEMVKAKTPKVTFYSEMGKCQLMESMEDFEVSFWECYIFCYNLP